MRILIWILLLLGLAFAVSRYHDAFMSDARETRETQRREFLASEGLPDGFGHAIVGGASGAEPVEDAAPPPAAPKKGATPRDAGGAAPKAPSSPTGGTTHVVKPGESLSKICAAHYGTGKSDVVKAVAAYNKLPSVDALREGQTLRLPEWSALGLPPR